MSRRTLVLYNMPMTILPLTLKTIDLEDRHILREFCKKFPPYNDFEFASLWTYNPENRNAYGIVNDNLVIKIQDFLTGEFFYSFLGTYRVKETIEILLSKCNEDGIKPQLRLIPEVNISHTPDIEKYFFIKEDPDSFDYVLSVEEVAILKGSKFHEKRNLVNSFKNLYPDHQVTRLNLDDEQIREHIKVMLRVWEMNKGKTSNETIMEFTAIERLIESAHIHDIICLGVYLNSKCIGFVTFHIVHDNYAILSFEKGDIRYKGIYEYLNHQAAIYLKSLGVTYINYEQDLGIPGLKKAKTLWRPVHFLKKYTIE
jgi:uncharacterized protein